MATNTNAGDLLVDRLTIQNFRQFESLSIDRLAQVNLIVGRNGVGKTSLLEAIRILATLGAPQVLWEMISSRDELGQSPGEVERQKIQQNGLLNLFRRNGHIAQMSIASTRRTLVADLGWYRELWEGDQFLRSERIQATATARLGSVESVESDRSDIQPMLYVTAGPLQRRVSLTRRHTRPTSEVGGEYPCLYVGSSGIDSAECAKLWDKIALTSAEDEVVASLALVYPGLTRISLTASDDGRTRTPRVRFRDYDQPVSLRSLGDGVSRIFGVALALVNAGDGILLIDEIENGIHYSVQPQIWQFLFEAARRFRVQVFATTHSTDAIRAFQWAAAKNAQVEGLLTRIEERAGRFSATQFDEADLGIAVTEAIEVR